MTHKYEHIYIYSNDLYHSITETDVRPEAQHLRANIKSLQDAVDSLNENIVNQRETASRNLSTWKEYEVGIQQFKPWIEEAEMQAASIGSKPSTLPQATEMLHTAQKFEQQCAEHLPRLQSLSHISQQLGGRSSAPDEVDTVHSRWNSVHDVAAQTKTKLEKLVSAWNIFESDANEFKTWLVNSESAVLVEPNVQTSDINKLEQELSQLKDFNKEISTRQAQLITLTQVSDQISHGLSIEGATNLKSRVTELKGRVQKLADTVRHQINSTSDAILSQNEFQIKISDFENWMSSLRQNMFEMSDVHVDDVDSNLQAIHVHLQEHSEKQPQFANIYEEIKQLSTKGLPEEAANLDEMYSSLAAKYKSLEDDLLQKKKALEKWTELINWNQETRAQLDHYKYEIEARKPTIDECERLSGELKNIQKKINTWKEQIPVVDSALGIQVRDVHENPVTASSLINDLESEIISLENNLIAKRNKLENLSTKWDNFRKSQQQLTEDIVGTQTALQDITYNVDTCEKLKPAIEKISNLIEDHELRASAKEMLHEEGAELLKDDQRSMTNVQVVLSSVDSNYEKVSELLHDQKKKYTEMETAYKQYIESKGKLTAFIDESRNICNSVKEAPSDMTEATLAVEKHKKALETLKKGKPYLEKMDSKAQQIIKEASLMPNFNHDFIESNVTSTHKNYQDCYSNIIEKIQLYETQVIIWKQIDDAKQELNRWLSDTNESLTSACEHRADVENGQARLIKFKEELPAHQLLRQGISSKTEQLLKLNQGVAIPTLTALNQVLDEQFRLVNESADKLEHISSSFSEKEQKIRQQLKQSSDIISKVREEVIKCDDLTGDNSNIVQRVQRCNKLKTELQNCGLVLQNVDANLVELSTEYPSITKTSIPKELQSLQARREAVANHAEKVSTTLRAFLLKLYNEKFTAVQRLVAASREKITWCEPESSSDKYNLEVKYASLLDVEADLNESDAKKYETNQALKLLEKIESPEVLKTLNDDREVIDVELESLKITFQSMKILLDKNIKTWERYESMSENVVFALKKLENKVRAENSSVLSLNEIEKKYDEIKEFEKVFLLGQTEMRQLVTFSHEITDVSPESRVEQYVNHLNARFETIDKFIKQYLDKLKQLKNNRNQYLQSSQQLDSWINGAEEKLKVYEEISGPKPISFYQSRLKELKTFTEDREKGQSLFNLTVEAGEALYSKINPDEREKIRSELRNLRTRLDNLTDRANMIYKKVENDMMHRSSFEDKYSQIKHWVIEAQAKLGNKQDLLPTLQEKKLALHSYRTIAQDVRAHKIILEQLHEKLGSDSDDESSNMLAAVIESYDKLSEDVDDRINVTEKHVANHEAYQQTFEKTRDWINTIVNETSILIDDLAIERETAKSSVNLVESVLQQKEEGDRIIDDCNQQLNIVLEQTSIPGHQALTKAFEEQKKIWQDFLARCAVVREKLNRLFDEWTEFQKVVEELEVWVKHIETQLKDQSLRSTEEAKISHHQKLISLEEEIVARAPEINAAVEKSQKIEVEPELVARVSKQATKYQALRSQARDSVARYEQYVKEHSSFNQRYNHFVNWIGDLESELKRHSEIVGDLSVLQQRQKVIRDLGDTRARENPKFESLIDLGERLYAHTSPDGREIVRQQLRTLKNLWDTFSDDLQGTTQKLDQCLMQFAEFSLSQEQLTTWLRDVEKAMHQHTELKSTLEEKRAQLQNHKIMHQEIMSHQNLVEGVCEKAQELVDQTQDTSLNVYLQSIKQLFTNIVAKSRDLLDNLEDCADKHNKFNTQCKAFSDWLQGEKGKLLECTDVSGERTDITRRLATLTILKDGRNQGMDLIKKLKDFAGIVTRSTAPKGQETIHNDIASLEAKLIQHLNEIGKYSKNLKLLSFFYFL